jgi:hypothetical protein
MPTMDLVELLFLRTQNAYLQNELLVQKREEAATRVREAAAYLQALAEKEKYYCSQLQLVNKKADAQKDYASRVMQKAKCVENKFYDLQKTRREWFKTVPVARLRMLAERFTIRKDDRFLSVRRFSKFQNNLAAKSPTRHGRP